jgi:hypothetical protein
MRTQQQAQARLVQAEDGLLLPDGDIMTYVCNSWDSNKLKQDWSKLKTAYRSLMAIS